MTLWAGSAACADEFVIIAATGEESKFDPGAMLDGAETIELADGAKITLLSKKGRMVQHVGPYSGPVAPKAPDATVAKANKWSSALSKIADVVAKDIDKSIVVGSSRDANDADRADEQPAVWLLAVDSSGHRCVRQSGADMWRKNADNRLEIDVRSRSQEEKGMVWTAGTDRLALPQKFIEDGTLIVMKVGAQPRRYNMHVLPQAIDADRWGDVLHWMVTSGCSRQARLLTDGLHSGTIALR